MLQQPLQQQGLKIGRDYLFGLMRDHGLLIRKRKRKPITTNSRHWMKKYSNLIKELHIDRPEQVWVSDITYIQLKSKLGYLSLITDAYSKRIVGWCFRDDLSTQGCKEALEMALSSRKYPYQPLIHHSDRGTQYCSKMYTDILIAKGIAISMTENGDPYENPVAERINETLKEEFDLHQSLQGVKQTQLKIKADVHTYNTLRPHASCDFLTPDQAHKQQGDMRKRWAPKKMKKIIV